MAKKDNHIPILEKRFYNNNVKIEVRENEDGTRTIEFYAAKFDTWSKNFGTYFREKIAKGFFDDVIDSDETVGLKNHNRDLVFGRNKFTLQLVIDDTGLLCRCTLPNTTLGNDLLEDIKLENIRSCSFSFILPEEGGDMWVASIIDEVKKDRTLLKAVELPDVSLVTYPAYNDTAIKIAKREFDANCKEVEKPEGEDKISTPSISRRERELQLHKH